MGDHRLLILGAVLFGACQGRPIRPDPADFPGALDDSGLAPIPNNCETLDHSFEVRTTGYIESTLNGFAVYEYRSAPEQRSTVIFRACDGTDEAPVVMSLNFYGVARVPPGLHPVRRTAALDGGFNFSYTLDPPSYDPVDNPEPAPLNCSDQPIGTVTITSSDFAAIAGSFDINARCIDTSIQNEALRPQEARFSGSFSANNIGVE